MFNWILTCRQISHLLTLNWKKRLLQAVELADSVSILAFPLPKLSVMLK